jgi:hypothetical protein
MQRRWTRPPEQIGKCAMPSDDIPLTLASADPADTKTTASIKANFFIFLSPLF